MVLMLLGLVHLLHFLNMHSKTLIISFTLQTYHISIPKVISIVLVLMLLVLDLTNTIFHFLRDEVR